MRSLQRMGAAMIDEERVGRCLDDLRLAARDACCEEALRAPWAGLTQTAGLTWRESGPRWSPEDVSPTVDAMMHEASLIVAAAGSSAECAEHR